MLANIRTDILSLVFSVLLLSVATAQPQFKRIAVFEHPADGPRRITGGREVEFSDNGTKLIAAYYGSKAQLYDLEDLSAVTTAIPTAGDGEIGFVNNDIAYTADWTTLRLWDTGTGKRIGIPMPHELREDTIISPAIGPEGKMLATRSTMQSVQLWNVTKRRQKGKKFQYPNEVGSIRFTDDGKFLLVRAGSSIYAIDTDSQEQVVGPINSGWRYYHFAQTQFLLTSEQAGDGPHQLVIRSTQEAGWPEKHRFDLPGKLMRLVALNDGQVFLQAQQKNYRPAMSVFSLANPEERSEVPTESDRAFGMVVPDDKRLWICSNIRDISCQLFGETGTLWQKPVPASGYDQKLSALDNEHFIIRNKQEKFGVYKISDGSQVWSQEGVTRFSVADGKLAICNRKGVEIWQYK